MGENRKYVLSLAKVRRNAEVKPKKPRPKPGFFLGCFCGEAWRESTPCLPG